MKKILAVLLVMFLFVIPVKAENFYEDSNLDKIEEALPKDAYEIFKNNEWNTENIGEKLDEKAFFTLIADFLKDGFKSVLSGAAAIVSLILLSSLMSSFSGAWNQSAVDTVCLLAAASSLTFSVYTCIEASRQTLTGVFTFISASIPVYLGILIAGGKTAVANSAGGIVITACQVMSYICSFWLSPVMNAYLAVGMCAAFADMGSINNLMNTVRKAGMWAYSFCVTIFLFILGTKSVVASFADNLTMKTAKFVLGTAVPVAGGALSESATVVAASLKVLRGGAGIYIITGIIIILLPLVCTLICHRFTLLFLKGLSDVFSGNKISFLLTSFETVISLLLGFVLLSLALLIISMGVMVKI